MERCRIATISLESPLGCPDETLQRIEQWAERARQQGAEIVLFPELSIPGYFAHRQRIRDLAEPVPGPSTQKLATIARKTGLVLCAGLFEQDAGEIYNTQILVGPDGLLGKQRKIAEPPCEAPYWRGGNEVHCFDINGTRFGIAICYDALVFEHWQALGNQGAEVILMPFGDDTGPRSTFLQEHREGITYRAHCYRFGCYGVLANAGGVHEEADEELPRRVFGGWCGVIDPHGTVVDFTHTTGHDEQMIAATLEPQPLVDARSHGYFIPTLTRHKVYS